MISSTSMIDHENINSHHDHDDEDSLRSSHDEIESVQTDSRQSTSSSFNESHNHNSIKVSSVGNQESRIINRTRLVLFGILIVAAATVSVTVYMISKNSQSQEFISRYDRVADQLIDTFQGIAKKHAIAYGALRVAYTAEARENNDSWPFVTLTSFQQRATTALRLSGAVQMASFPFVEADKRAQWERYVAEVGRTWIEESLEFEKLVGLETLPYSPDSPILNRSYTSVPIKKWELDTFPKYWDVADGTGPFLPLWQCSPLVVEFVNGDFYPQDNTSLFRELPFIFEKGASVIGHFILPPPGNRTTSVYADFLSRSAKKDVYFEGDPFSHFFYPVFKSFNQTDRAPMAILTSLFHWRSYFQNALQEWIQDVYIVLENPCQSPVTYLVVGQDVTYLGLGDHHDTQFDDFVRRSTLSDVTLLQDGTEFGIPFLSQCYASIRIYPSQKYYSNNHNNTPLFMTCAILLVFAFTTAVFLAFNRLVERRQQLTSEKAVQSSAIVSSLFPQAVADRLMKQSNDISDDSHSVGLQSMSRKLKSFLSGEVDGESSTMYKPIADLFPFATVMFADIAGFTAWSSSREPSQVFLLLQGIYLAFDRVAKRRNVFKVETIGDSYVAVTGVPEPQTKHATIMARFAAECVRKVRQVTAEMGITLGPGTSQLRMRFGIHSGQVTAGVLLGERARFQLFGDTVNTAARMESTGSPGRVHLSSEAATLLIQDDKEHWVTPRNDTVNVKGKGIFQTYWLNLEKTRRNNGSIHSAVSVDPYVTNPDSYDDNRNSSLSLVDNPSQGSAEVDRLVRWICELLQGQIKNIVRLNTRRLQPLKGKRSNTNASTVSGSTTPDFTSNNTDTVLNLACPIPLDEVVDTLCLPEYQKSNDAFDLTKDVELDEAVVCQLRMYIHEIAIMYRENPFHNFDHACHVTMSVNKLLQRIVTPDLDIDGRDVASHLYDYTHGINSDPITLLAILWSAVIHDADHQGISNVQLMKEQEHMANLYRGKSVAEQNSLDIAWKLLMADRFADLRKCIFYSDSEAKRFRQVLVNTVLATDIFDKELNDLRKSRWARAFAARDSALNDSDCRGLRATIVIEHVIQASDVSHTMQHWHVYRRWNEKLFHELYLAYKNGRMGANPCDFWYEGELGFFDNYIIPLAKKLKECQVFGVHSDEYLNYAERNRAEWEARGKDILADMKNKFCTTMDG